MRGRDKINICGSPCLKVKKNFGKMLYTYLSANIRARDYMILAEDTAQITAGKEDSSRTAVAGDTGFLPKVEGGSGQIKLGGNTAASRLPGRSIDTAAPRAETAGSIVRKERIAHKLLQKIKTR